MPSICGRPLRNSRARAGEMIEILPLTENALPSVLMIERSCFPDPWSEPLFRQELQDDGRRMALVITSDGKVAGYGIGWLVLDEFHLGNLAIGTEQRGQGLGRRLLSHMLDQAIARGCRMATLEVRASNETAKELYRSFGFKEVAIRKKYYGSEDALVMIAELPPAAGC